MMLPKKLTPIIQLLAFVIVVLFCAGYLLTIFATKGDLRSETDSSQITSLIATLRSENPDYILIGDSMLDTRVNQETISELSQRRFFLYCRGGSSTAAWYLYFKNVIAQAGIKPRAIIFFYRNQYLTWPRFRVDDMYKANLNRLRVGEDSVVNMLINPGPPRFTQPVDWTRYFLFGPNGVFFSKTASSEFNRRLDNLALDLTAFGVGKANRKLAMANRFNLASLRADLGSEMPAEDSGFQNTNDARPRVFDPSPRKSFLPHIVALGRENQIPLVFFRVKCRPAEASYTPQTREMIQYTKNLRSWLESQHCSFFDETDDPAITLSMYQDGDHISTAFRPWWSEYFWKRMEPSLP